MKRTVTGIGIGAALILVGACGGDEEVGDVVEGPSMKTVADELAATELEIATYYPIADALSDDFYAVAGATASPVGRQTSLASSEDLAAEVAARAPDYFEPDECVQATSDGPTATIQLNDCESVLGVDDISGVVTAMFSEIPAGRSLHVSTVDLQIEDWLLDLEVDATGSSLGDERSLEITSTATLSGPDGTFTHENQTNIEWTRRSGCTTAEATGSGRLGRADYTTELTGYRRCSGECPSAGTLTLTGEDDSTLTLTFDGTDSPALVSSTGAETELDLDCREVED